MKATDADVLWVFRETTRIGELRRMPLGSTFEYLSNVSSDAAFTLPTAQRAFETSGPGNVHSFFAGLLPEGYRLTALVRKTKTSEDDHFSLLSASGENCIGDISVWPEGDEPKEPEIFDLSQTQALDFEKLLARSIARIGEPGDINVPGVQEKVSASMVSIPLRGKEKSGSFILKLNPRDRPLLIENEAFFMRMAADCGLTTADARLVHDNKKAAGLLVRRFDRESNGAADVRKLHQEDACQFLNRYPADKYRLKSRDIAQGVARFASSSVIEVARFIELTAFSYLIGNGDLHGKNVSLLRSRDGAVALSPAYDLLSTWPYGDRRMALEFEGRDDNLKRAHLLAFAKRHSVAERFMAVRLDALLERASAWLPRLPEIGFSEKQTKSLTTMMNKRLNDLFGPR